MLSRTAARLTINDKRQTFNILNNGSLDFTGKPVILHDPEDIAYLKNGPVTVIFFVFHCHNIIKKKSFFNRCDDKKKGYEMTSYPQNTHVFQCVTALKFPAQGEEERDAPSDSSPGCQ